MSQPFFGPKWDAPATDDAPQTGTPVGERCYLCQREIVQGDQGWIRAMVLEAEGQPVSGAVHRGCEMGTIVGHTFGFCSCTGWDDLWVRGEALIACLDRLSSFTTLEAKAMRIAVEAHADQVDKSGQPYLLHPLRVMDSVTGEIPRAIAVLHDVLEDSDFTPEDLHAAGMPSRVVKAVVDLTHLPNEPRVYYYERIRKNQDALLVKMADIADNTKPERLEKLDAATRNRLIVKYATAMQQLSE